MTVNEKSFVISIMHEYVKIYERIHAIEKKLNRIEERKNVNDSKEVKELKLQMDLESERMNIFRKVEYEFWDEIKNKYGPGFFDVSTLEYKLNSNAGN